MKRFAIQVGALLALPLQLLAQALPPGASPGALRDPSERLIREQQERERAPNLRPQAVPEAAEAVPKDDPFAPFPGHLKAEGPAFRVEQIESTGTTLMDAGEFRRIVQVFEGQQLAAMHIQALLDRLTRALVAAGYITSRAHVDAQNIAQGRLSVSVQAGRIEQIRYNNQDIDTHGQLLAPLSHVGVRLALPMQRGDVLRLADIEQAVDQINRLRRNKVEVQILPGEQPSGSIVSLTNRPDAARSYTASIDNQGASNTGRIRIQAGLEQGNALGLMEALSLGLVTSTETNPDGSPFRNGEFILSDATYVFDSPLYGSYTASYNALVGFKDSGGSSRTVTLSTVQPAKFSTTPSFEVTTSGTYQIAGYRGTSIHVTNKTSSARVEADFDADGRPDIEFLLDGPHFY